MKIKHKEWVASVHRVRGETENRHGLLRLEKNERITPFPSPFWQKVAGLLTHETVQAYPEPERVYAALAKFHNLDISSFVLTSGSDGAIRNGFDLCVNSGDAVITLDPTFAMVDVYCKLFKAEKRGIPYDTDLQLNVSALMDAIDDKVSLLVIANPNSPTGTLIKMDMMEQIVAKADKYGIVVLIDEAYHGFCRQTCLPFIGKYENVMITRTFSKAGGAAGLRIGYIVASPSLAALLYRFRPMYEVNSFACLYALALLENWDVVESYLMESEKGKAFFCDELRRLAYIFRDTHANFVHVDFRDKKNAASELFEREGVKVRGGLPIKGYENYLRVTTGPVEPMRRFIAMLEKV